MATRRCGCEPILDCHPEMILVSESPVTWEGFLIVPHLLYGAGDARCSRVKLKLIIPNYPSFDNAQIGFGRHIAFLRNREFSRKVKESMKSAQTVLSFLKQLQSLIDKYMHNTYSKIHKIDFKSTSDFLKDVKAALQNPSAVKLSCDRNLNIIKLSLRGISLTLQRYDNVENPWTVISSDMPAIPMFEQNVTEYNNLSVAMTKFQMQVEIFEKAWEQLKELDENCWVIDPQEPNKCHMYRRIHLSQSISVTITIDPLHPTDFPLKVTFSGSDNEVKRQTAIVSNNIDNWNKNCSILENLRMLLNMDEFPEQQDTLDDSVGIIGNRECGICFSEKSETDELPNKICNNEKCMKYFHSACLARWLQMNAGNQVVFGHIHGNCPHCKENISCFIE